MKSFVALLGLAAAANAEADPQLLLNTHAVPVHHAVHASPLLKTIVPAVTATKYVKPVAVHAPLATQYVQTQYLHHQPLVHNVEIKPVEAVQAVEYKKEEEEKKEEEVQQVVYNTYAHPQQVAYTQYQYAQPAVTYAHQPAAVYAQPAAVYQPAAVHYAQPLNKVYHAKNGDVEHTVINKREAEAEPIDYLRYQTGPYSFKSVPTLGKTLSAYNKVPYYTAPVVAHQQYAAHVPYVNTPYTAAVAHPYQYTYPTYF